jgi:enamine deaminase RidA (YjgF/YER057c/UK114 family)
MSSVPIPMNQLEDITTAVARDLLEQWAINDRFTLEELEEAKKNVVEDTIFVINNFMEHFNNLMMQASQETKSVIK